MPEVFLGVSIHVQRRQEGDVEIARREAEGGAVVATHDGGNIAGSQVRLCFQQSTGPMVIGGDRQRPGAQQTVVVEHQIGRRFGGRERIHAFIDQ